MGVPRPFAHVWDAVSFLSSPCVDAYIDFLEKFLINVEVFL